MERFIGQTLKSRYLINEIIGVGGMAVVYKAYDTIQQQDVAVKILKDEYMRDEEFRRRFVNEFKAIALLSDKNIVDIYDVSLEGEIMFIAMEYLDGVTLKEYFDSVGTLQWREATQYIKQILSAVQHAHERGVIHRDIKPHNIMLSRSGAIKMMDFGIAMVSDYETKSLGEETIGSVHYISPEQASGDELDERADIYSIGIMLYQLVTGILPFDSDNPVSVALMQIQDQPKLPRDVNPDIPQGLEQIILHAIMKDPLERYDEASDMLSDIERLEENPARLFKFDRYIDNQFIPLVPDVAGMEDEDLPPYQEAPLTKEEKRKLSTKIPILLGILSAGFLFIGILCSMLIVPDAISEELIEVPKLMDLQFDDVKNNSKYKDFKIVVRSEMASEKPKGTILRQTPDPGDSVKKGTTIRVDISSGNTKVCIPDFTGMTEAEIYQELDKHQIAVKIEEEYHDYIPKGCFIRCTPDIGDEIDTKDETVVVIYISKGPRTVRVEVPGLVDLTLDEAKGKIVDAGLTLGTVTEEYHDTKEVGVVIAQTPSKGTNANKNSVVDLVVSKGPDPDKQPEQGQVCLSIKFDETYAGKTMKIDVSQDISLLSVEVSYDSLTNGEFTWDGVANTDLEISILVDGVVVRTAVISSGLNNINVSMTQEEETPTDAAVSLTLNLRNSYAQSGNQLSITIDINGITVKEELIDYREAYYWSSTLSEGTVVSVSVDGVQVGTYTVTAETSQECVINAGTVVDVPAVNPEPDLEPTPTPEPETTPTPTPTPSSPDSTTTT